MLFWACLQSSIRDVNSDHAAIIMAWRHLAVVRMLAGGSANKGWPRQSLGGTALHLRAARRSYYGMIVACLR